MTLKLLKTHPVQGQSHYLPLQTGLLSCAPSSVPASDNFANPLGVKPRFLGDSSSHSPHMDQTPHLEIPPSLGPGRAAPHCGGTSPHSLPSPVPTSQFLKSDSFLTSLIHLQDSQRCLPQPPRRQTVPHPSLQGTCHLLSITLETLSEHTLHLPQYLTHCYTNSFIHSPTQRLSLTIFTVWNAPCNPPLLEGSFSNFKCHLLQEAFPVSTRKYSLFLPCLYRRCLALCGWLLNVCLLHRL